MHLEYHNLKEFYFDPITHIGGWYIPDDICDGVIDFFHSEKANWISGSKRLDTDQNIFMSNVVYHSPMSMCPCDWPDNC